MSRAESPGPTGKCGGINHLRAIRRDFRQFSHQIHREFGDVVHYRVLGQDVYQFASPELAHEVLVGAGKSLHKPDNQKRAFARVIGLNLFTSDGEAWSSRRRLMAPLFQPQIIDTYRSIVIRQAESIFKRLNEGEVNLSPSMNCVALLSVAQALFGSAIFNVVDEFLAVAGRLQGAITRQILSPILLPMWMPTRDNRTIRRSLQFFHRMISGLIAARRKEPAERGDLLDALLGATDEEAGTRLQDREVIDEALTLLLAGSDTTAAALSWSALLLAQHPDVQERLYAEVQAAAGGGPLQPEHAARMPLAEQVFQEAMRIYPPAIAIARQAVKPVQIGGVAVPRRALAFVSVYTIHRDARWFADPEVFRPDRFAADSIIPEHAYLPFGLGPRACIGHRFARMEGQLVVAELVRQFRIELPYPDYQPELETQLSLHPKGGVRLRLIRR